MQSFHSAYESLQNNDSPTIRQMLLYICFHPNRYFVETGKGRHGPVPKSFRKYERNILALSRYLQFLNTNANMKSVYVSVVTILQVYGEIEKDRIGSS